MIKGNKRAIAIAVAAVTTFSTIIPGRTPVKAAAPDVLTRITTKAMADTVSTAAAGVVPGISTLLSENLMAALENHDVSFINYSSGRALNDYHSITKEAAVIDTYPFDNTRSVMWMIQYLGNSVRIKSKHAPAKGVDVKSGGTHKAAAGQEVRLYTPSAKDKLSEWEFVVDIGRSTNDQIVIQIVAHDNPSLKIAHPSNDSDGTKRKCLVISSANDDTTRWILADRDGKNLTMDMLTTDYAAKCAEIRDNIGSTIDALRSEIGSKGENAKAWLKSTYNIVVSAYCVTYVNYIWAKAGYSLLNTSGYRLTYVPAIRDEFSRLGALYSFDSSKVKTGDLLLIGGQHAMCAYKDEASGKLYAFHGNWSGKVQMTEIKNGKVGKDKITHYGSICEYLIGVKD